jgi:hypothetical protein
MNKSLLTTFAFLLTISLSYAQIPNSGFENWSGTDPVGWATTNQLALLANPLSVFNSPNAHSGNGACQMKAVHVINKPPGVPIPDYVGSIFVGKQVQLNSYRGFPYALRPVQFEFWNTYTGQAGDTANALVALTKWDTTNHMADTIAIGVYFRSNFDSTYSKAIVPLNYFSSETPDTAIILFSAVQYNSTQAGAVFTIDDLQFNGGNAGINESVSEDAMELYPNPVHGHLYIRLQPEHLNGEIQLSDLEGREIRSVNLKHQSTIDFDLSSVDPGIYFVRLNSTQKIQVKQIIIE